MALGVRARRSPSRNSAPPLGSKKEGADFLVLRLGHLQQPKKSTRKIQAFGEDFHRTKATTSVGCARQDLQP